MKKVMIKKFLYTVILFITLLSLSGNVFASNSIVINSGNTVTPSQTASTLAPGVTKLELVEDNICNININDIGKFEKKLTDFNAENKSVTITLTMKNLKTIEESQLPVEIFLVLDNSSSMIQNTINEQTRKDVIINSANKMIDKLFEANANAKVGIVSFSSLDSAKGETEGTINDAKLWLNLTNSKTDVESTIASIADSETGPRTNIEAGITLASQNYSSTENTKRYIVLLTDGVPNNALDGSFGTYVGNVASRTKAKLQEIEQSGIGIIGAMIGLDGEEVETQSGKTYKALAEEVFGTVENPTISSYYYIADNKDEIETTIVDKVFNGIVSVKDNTLKNIVIKDYFPKEIIENFNFEYVANPNIGTISEKINTTDNSITWTIPLLREEETATVSYKLTLKENYNKEIVNKILPTNEKVDITAEDIEHDKNNPYKETSTDTPKIRVLYTEPSKPVDNTTAPTVIPQTGDITTWFVVMIGMVSIIAIIRFIYLNKTIN